MNIRTLTIPLLASVSLVAALPAGPVGAGGAGSAPPAGVPSAPPPKATCPLPGSGYGRMFPAAPAASWSTSAIDALSAAMIAPQETSPTPEGARDAEEALDIPAGYTYFGQFVDHDLTLDARPDDLVTPTQVSSLVNGRTPQLDLDSVYGSGPTGSPLLYQSDLMHMKVGSALTGSPDTGAVDLPRDSKTGQAVIGDPRNDENRMVAAIHALFLRYHNKVVDRIRAEQPTLSAAKVFSAARAEVVATYQRIVVDDFLPTIAGQQTVGSVLSRSSTGAWQSKLLFYSPCQQMPVEFSVAAYRFGHSMVRPSYRLNSTMPSRLPVFSGTYTPGADVSGFYPSPTGFAVDWNLFLPAPNQAPGKVQASYRIDGSLTYSLSLLPLPTTGAGPANLAKRNVLRAQQLALPSGQAVARAIGVTPLRDDQILVGKATGAAADTRAITAVSNEFAGKAPLWAYVLAEATANAYQVSGGRVVGPQRGPVRLGPVGGRIVVETIVGLLVSDPASVLNHPEVRLRREVAPIDRGSLRALTDFVAAPAGAKPPAPAPTPGPAPAPAPAPAGR